MCVQDLNGSVPIGNKELCPVINGYNAMVSTTAGYEPRTKEPRANRNVTTKTVSAEPLEVEDPSAGGWAGYS